jgi:hypothetical protein
VVYYCRDSVIFKTVARIGSCVCACLGFLSGAVVFGIGCLDELGARRLNCSPMIAPLKRKGRKDSEQDDPC